MNGRAGDCGSRVRWANSAMTQMVSTNGSDDSNSEFSG